MDLLINLGVIYLGLSIVSFVASCIYVLVMLRKMNKEIEQYEKETDIL